MNVEMMVDTRGAGDQSPLTGHRSPPADGWVAVCRLEDIVPGTGVCARLNGRQVAVFRVDDRAVYAIDNHDPFSHANVLSRGIVGDLKGELVVASPVYKQHFSLLTGRCIEDDSVSVAVYRAAIRDADVLVLNPNL
jgi:nitrite reductase (NADH) small subunit